MYANHEGSCKQKAEGKRIASRQNKGLLSSWTKKQMVRLVLGMYKLSKLFWPWLCLSLLDDSGPGADTCFDARALSLLLSPLPFSQRTHKTPSTYTYTAFISDLVPAKSVTVDKNVEAD